MKKVFLACILISMVLLLNSCPAETEVEPASSDVKVELQSSALPTESAAIESVQTESKAEEKKTPTASEQLSLINKKVSDWRGEGDIEPYCYAVTDLNQNGRLEIAAATCQGTGLFTSCDLYEVNENFDGLKKIDPKLPEGEFWPDIIVEEADVFYDSSSNTYHYIMDDTVRISMGEAMDIKTSVDISGGNVKITQLASAHSTADENMEMISKFYLPNDKEISEEEFEKIADKTYSKCEKHHVKFGWETVEPGEFENTAKSKCLICSKNLMAGLNLNKDFVYKNKQGLKPPVFGNCNRQLTD